MRRKAPSSLMLAGLVLAACPGRPPADPVVDVDGGARSGFLPCDEEEDCESLGPGHMCMNAGCMVMDVHAPAVQVPPPSQQDLEPVRLVDVDPDPGRFEADLVAVADDVEIVPGAATPAWVYKGAPDDAARIPGPLIEVEKGTRVVVRFQNLLDEETTIHWHGLVLPHGMDGAPMPTASIPPSGSFTFDFVVEHPALYWFHPHHHGEVQIERGLYGLLVVRDAPEREPAVDVERILALDDILLDDAGAIVPPEDGPAHDETGRMTFASMMGRQGNHLLVNGRRNPIVQSTAGSVERWRIVNTANARFFKLALPGHAFRVVGTDGGLLEEPFETDELLISPGERYDVLVSITGEVGDEIPLVTRHHDRGHDMADPGDLPLLQVRLVDARAPAAEPPPTSAVVERLPSPATAAHRVVMGEKVLRGARVGFTLNGEMWPDVTPRTARLGDVELWEIVNDTHMDHPFHLHGFRFQVLSRQDEGGAVVPEPRRAWKDTVVVGPEQTLRFVVRYDGFPGEWMMHCHILEHAERGMMSSLLVEGH